MYTHKINYNRIRTIKEGIDTEGPVAYWMSRDQRVQDNWAMIAAQKSAIENHRPLIVIFALSDNFPGANERHYSFMFKGLMETEKTLRSLNIPFYILKGYPGETIPLFCKENKISKLFTDFDPLRIKREWKKDVSKKSEITILETDAHNIVPCWVASQKLEFGAYTLRPKIKKLIDVYLDDIPALEKHPYNTMMKFPENNYLIDMNKYDIALPQVDWITPGAEAAGKMLKKFITEKLSNYTESRNDPNVDGQSNLSPYLHFGHLSAQRAAIEVMRSGVHFAQEEAFLEEMIIRRELADNFCSYNKDYDNYDGFPKWCRETLDIHRTDKREYIYNKDAFENADTHDKLWNSAQKQMALNGKMHGYLRMYWAKKILEWSASPEDAIETAIFLNDKYELDGRDPNGYTGIAWSIGGVHDRPWKEREIFGKIRYMNSNGCKKKFDIQLFIENH